MLTADGHAAAEAAGRWMLKNGWPPDLILTSHAERAFQTAEEVRFAGENHPAIVRHMQIYGADAEGLLSILREQDNSGASTILLVGHNPGIAELALGLAGRLGDRAMLAKLRGFAPATVACFTLETGSWQVLGPSTARLDAVATFA